jgi:hypothetical protein
MFDNLRDQANAAPIPDEDPKFDSTTSGTGSKRRSSSGHFLGMTPEQRFFVTFIIMIMVVILGMMCLLVTGRISLF